MNDYDLIYAATARCKCGAGLAHPRDHEKAFNIRAWVCSDMLKADSETVPALAPLGAHDSLAWSLYKVREETLR